MSGEGVTSMVVGHGRGVAFGGAPTSSVPAPSIDPGITAVSERANVVAFLHGLADQMTREAFAPGVSEDDCAEMDRRAGVVYRAARSIANGEHWR